MFWYSNSILNLYGPTISNLTKMAFILDSYVLVLYGIVGAIATSMVLTILTLNTESKHQNVQYLNVFDIKSSLFIGQVQLPNVSDFEWHPKSVVHSGLLMVYLCIFRLVFKLWLEN